MLHLSPRSLGRSAVLGAALTTLCTSAHAQLNEHTFYNDAIFSATTATRATTGFTDQIYFSQPVNFRRNVGKASGWRVVLQDQDPRTAEQVRLSYHALQLQSIVPDKVELTGANFAAFGNSSTSGARSFIYSFTLAAKIALPDFSALGIQLPAPVAWPADACTIHFQRGDRTQVATPARQQWSYKLELGAVIPEWRTGSAFRFGGLYESPVLQTVNASNAYNSSVVSNLQGPESIEFASAGTRIDRLAFRAEGGQRFRTAGTQLGVAALFLSANYRSSPLPIPPFGTLLLDEVTTTFLSYIVLDSQGEGRAVVGPVPANTNLTLGWQGFFIGIDTNRNELNTFELSNATRTVLR